MTAKHHATLKVATLSFFKGPAEEDIGDLQRLVGRR